MKILIKIKIKMQKERNNVFIWILSALKKISGILLIITIIIIMNLLKYKLLKIYIYIGS